jgi:hypothetical protein
MSKIAQDPVETSTGDGGTEKVSDELLTGLKAEVDLIKAELSVVGSTRSDTLSTRLCYWDNQSSDGRKHAEDNSDDEDAMPFEGACDSRVRISDMLVNEEVMLLSLAALRGQIQCKGRTSEDSSKAGALTIILRYVLRNQLGWKWVREIIKLAQFYCADSPATALLSIHWKQTKSLTLETITTEDLMKLYLSRVAETLANDIDKEEATNVAMQAAQHFTELLKDEQQQDSFLVEVLMSFFEGLKEKRAKVVIRQLRKEGKAEFPVPSVTYSGIDVKAKRLYEDWFIASSTTLYENARISIETEWITKTRLQERKHTLGWKQDFVDGVLKQEGKQIFPVSILRADQSSVTSSENDFRGLYQVATAYFQASNEDDIPGRYFVTFHPDVETTATDKQLLEYKHGQYPGFAFQREVLNDRLLDSRGIPELSMSNQSLLKLYVDSSGDNAQLCGVPPILTRNRRGQGKLYIQPMGEIPMKRDGEVAWMNPPISSPTVPAMIAELRRQIDEYHGRSNPSIPPELVTLHNEFKVMWWLEQMREVIKQIIQLIQQWMSDEEIARITDNQNIPVARSVKEIQGQFDVDITYDPRDRDPEFIQTLGTVIKDILMLMDRDKTIQMTPIVEALLWRLAPDLAAKALQPVDRAQKTELEEEWKNYVQILGGVEPAMVTDGSQNYPLRLNMYESMQAANPNVFASLAPDRKAILDARIQHLTVMSEQYGANQEIGRTGTKPADLQQAPEAPAAAPAAA